MALFLETKKLSGKEFERRQGCAMFHSSIFTPSTKCGALTCSLLSHISHLTLSPTFRYFSDSNKLSWIGRVVPDVLKEKKKRHKKFHCEKRSHFFVFFTE